MHKPICKSLLVSFFKSWFMHNIFILVYEKTIPPFLLIFFSWKSLWKNLPKQNHRLFSIYIFFSCNKHLSYEIFVCCFALIHWRFGMCLAVQARWAFCKQRTSLRYYKTLISVTTLRMNSRQTVNSSNYLVSMVPT